MLTIKAQLHCDSCGTKAPSAVETTIVKPKVEKLPYGWTEQKDKHVCPLCSKRNGQDQKS